MKYYSLDDGWFYYGNLNDNNKLYKVKADGTTNQKMYDDPIGSIASVGDYIYYSNSSNNNYLYKINKDGTDKVMVDNTMVANIIYINNNELRYHDGDLKNENKIKNN